MISAAEVAAVVVNWNNFDQLEALLESLVVADPVPGTVVVVDNGSTDGSAERALCWADRRLISWRCFWENGVCLRESAPQKCSPFALELVLSNRNRGFGGGVNLGIQLATRLANPRFILLLNSDVRVSPDFLAPLLLAIDEPGIGVVTGLIKYANGSGTIWYAGGSIDYLRATGRHDPVNCRRIAARDVEFVSGCMALIRTEVLETVGMFPDEYFLYMEDVEFSLRVRQAGYRLRFEPACIVFHVVSASAGHPSSSPAIAFLQSRNRFWFARRNLRGRERTLALLWLIGSRIVKAAAAFARGKRAVSSAIVKGLAAGLLGRLEHSRPTQRTGRSPLPFVRAR